MRRAVFLILVLLTAALLVSCAEKAPVTVDTPPPAEAAPPAETPTPAPSPPAISAAPATSLPSPTPTAADSTAVPASSPQPGTTAGENTLTVTLGGKTTVLQAKTRRYALREDPALAFTLAVPTEGVTAEFISNAWRYTTLAAPEEAFLELSLVQGAKAETLQPSLMDSYLDFQDIEFSTAADLGALHLSANAITASSNSRLVRAWLLDVEGGTVCVVLSLELNRLDDACNLLQAMLDSFLLEK